MTNFKMLWRNYYGRSFVTAMPDFLTDLADILSNADDHESLAFRTVS